MTSVGVFGIILNDGKQDNLLMATPMLHERLAVIAEKNRLKGAEDPTPKLSDIEKTHVLFTNPHFKPFAAMAYEYKKVPIRGNQQLSTTGSNTEITFEIPQYGDFFYDMFVHAKLNAPTVSTEAIDDQDLVRYCDYPGHRLLKRVAFEVNGQELDWYDSDYMTLHRHFKVKPGKKLAWDRCVGQEVPRVGYNATVVGAREVREKRSLCEGHQTPKEVQANLEMFIPLLFWFNLDPRLAIPSVAIPHNQRFIKIQLATGNEMAGSVAQGAESATFTAPTLDLIELYINNIFVTPQVHDIYIKRIGFNLIRVHRRHFQRLTKDSDNILLSQLKWPIETMFFGIRPTNNYASSNEDSMEDWWRFNDPSKFTYNDLVTNTADMKVEDPTIDWVSLEIHGVSFYNQMPYQFFNSYVPGTYGGTEFQTPEDIGALMMNFCLYPGSYQPSGHINISRGREIYLEYSSSVVSSEATADLVVWATAINFLLISDGSALLRYAT